MGTDNALRKKAVEITDDIIRLTKKTEETPVKIMEALYAFGETVTDKTESENHLTEKIKCSKGCSYCCYAQVSVTPVEAILIGNYLKSSFSLSRMDRMLKHIRHNMSLTEGKSFEERVKIWEQTPCIFLDDGICSIYEQRPLICREWHSLSVEQCKKAFESLDQEAEIESFPYRSIILASIRDGMVDVFKKEGLRYETAEMTFAMKSVLHHPAPDLAWVEGEDIFIG